MANFIILVQKKISQDNVMPRRTKLKMAIFIIYLQSRCNATPTNLFQRNWPKERWMD